MAFKNTEPDKYKSIFELESHKEERKRTGRLEKDIMFNDFIYESLILQTGQR